MYTVGLPIALVLVGVQWLLSKAVRDTHPAASPIWKLLFRALWVVGLTAGLTSQVLVLGYHHTFRPDPPSGRIYRYTEHGTVMYFTADERFAVRVLNNTFMYSVFAAFVVFFFLQREQDVANDRKYIRPSDSTQ
jgi:hypothetical protein